MSWLRNQIVAAIAALIAANSLADTPVYAARTENALASNELAARGSALDDLNAAAVEAVTFSSASVRATDARRRGV